MGDYLELYPRSPSDPSFSPHISSQAIPPNLTSLSIATPPYFMTTIICVVSYSRFAETLKELDLTGRYTSFRDAQDLVQTFSFLCSGKSESVSGDPRSPAASSLEVQMGLLTLSPQLVDLLAEDFPGRMTSTSETKTDRCVLAVNANTFLSGLEALEDRCLEVEHEIAVPGTVCGGVCKMRTERRRQIPRISLCTEFLLPERLYPRLSLDLAVHGLLQLLRLFRPHPLLYHYLQSRLENEFTTDVSVGYSWCNDYGESGPRRGC